MDTHHELILSSGQNVQADGWLVQSNSGVPRLTLPELGSGQSSNHSPYSVRLGGLEEQSIGQDRHVHVIGQWDGQGAIAVGSIAGIARPRDPMASILDELKRHVAQLADSERPRQIEEAVLSSAKPTVSALIEDGSLLLHSRLHLPDGSQCILATAADSSRVRSELTPLYGPSLVVIQSRWNKGIVDTASKTLATGADNFQIYRFGEGVGRDGDLRIDLGVVQVVPTSAAWLDETPTGLVDLDVWIRPHR